MGTETVQVDVDKKISGTSDKVKYITTFTVYYCTFTFGCAFTFLSPTVIDFKNKFDTDVQQVSVVFTILTASYLFGAFGYGLASRFLGRKYLVTFLMGCMCVPLYVVPHLPNLILFFIVSFILGFGAGGYDALQVSWIIEVWRERSDPFILGQHFVYAVGTVVPPLLLGPFLTADEEDGSTSKKCFKETTEIAFYNGSISTSMTPSENADLFIPFTIAASLSLGGFLLLVFYYLKFGQTESQKVDVDGQKDSNNDNDNYVDSNKGQEKWRQVIMLILSCCVIASYQGMELTTMQFLPTFAVYSDLCLSEAQGADQLFGLTLAFACFRAAGILLVLRIPPQYLLCGNFLLLLGGNIILLFWAQTSLTMMWTGSVMMGAGMSTVYGGYYAFIQKHLHVTPFVASTVAVSGGLISAIYPLIVGTSVEDDVSILCYVNFVSILILVCSFGITYWFTMIRVNGNINQKPNI